LRHVRGRHQAHALGAALDGRAHPDGRGAAREPLVQVEDELVEQQRGLVEEVPIHLLVLAGDDAFLPAVVALGRPVAGLEDVAHGHGGKLVEALPQGLVPLPREGAPRGGAAH